MINTIEVAPAILAASLAQALKKHFDVYPIVFHNGFRQAVHQHDLREFIKTFLTDKTNDLTHCS